MAQVTPVDNYLKALFYTATEACIRPDLGSVDNLNQVLTRRTTDISQVSQRLSRFREYDNANLSAVRNNMTDYVDGCRLDYIQSVVRPLEQSMRQQSCSVIVT